MGINIIGQKYKTKKFPRGFSLVELLLAGAVFAVFATGVVEALLFGLAADRLGEETTLASEYAAEGMEALRSIRAKNFDDLSFASATGLARDTGDWVLSGENNTFEKYTRVIEITEVKRSDNGDIDESGGTSDPDTKKATVTVSWNVTPARADSVVLETFFTRFKL